MPAPKNMRSIYIEDDMWQDLKIEAASTPGLNVSKIIREALEERAEKKRAEKKAQREQRRKAS